MRPGTLSVLIYMCEVPGSISINILTHTQTHTHPIIYAQKGIATSEFLNITV